MFNAISRYALPILLLLSLVMLPACVPTVHSEWHAINYQSESAATTVGTLGPSAGIF